MTSANAVVETPEKPSAAAAAAASEALDVPADPGEWDGKRVAVLCFTYGEPPSTSFRDQATYSYSILNRLTRMVAPPFIRPLFPVIALTRGRGRQKLWSEEGYNSPLEEITLKQVAAIRERLREARPNVEWDVREVYEFRRPFLYDVLRGYRDNPPDKVLGLPLYLAESDYTHNISRNDFASFQKRSKGWKPDPSYVLKFGYDERMADVFADFALRYCEENGWGADRRKNAALVLGAHGTLAFPKKGVESGRKETSYFFGLLRHRLRERFKTMRLGWLNHDFGGEWTAPDMETLGGELWDKGVRDLVYFPFGFFADNAESELEGRMILREWEWENYLHLPCPNDDPALTARLAEMALDVLEGRADSPKFEAKNLR